MNIDAGAPQRDGAREVYKLLDELDRHINSHDASGRAVLYEAKERLRMLMISMDRSMHGDPAELGAVGTEPLSR